jgi:hypothetical protein
VMQMHNLLQAEECNHWNGQPKRYCKIYGIPADLYELESPTDHFVALFAAASRVPVCQHSFGMSRTSAHLSSSHDIQKCLRYSYIRTIVCACLNRNRLIKCCACANIPCLDPRADGDRSKTRERFRSFMAVCPRCPA